MSSIDKSIVSNLEGELGSIDYGEDELNQAFKSLDEETKKKVLKYANKDIQISILRNILNTKFSVEYSPSPSRPLVLNFFSLSLYFVLLI